MAAAACGVPSRCHPIRSRKTKPSFWWSGSCRCRSLVHANHGKSRQSPAFLFLPSRQLNELREKIDNVSERADNRWRFSGALTWRGTIVMNSEISGVTRRIVVVVAAIALAAGLGACGKQEDKAKTGSSLERVVKIGHAAPLTGEIAHLGKDNENGARLAIEEANAKGLTIGGQKVVFEEAGIPMISGSATNPKLTERGLKVAFRTVGRDDQQGPAIASYLNAQFKPRTVAVVDDGTSYGEGLADQVELTLK